MGTPGVREQAGLLMNSHERGTGTGDKQGEPRNHICMEGRVKERESLKEGKK